MNTGKAIIFAVVNIVGILAIAGLIDRRLQVKKYGERFRPHSFIMRDTVSIASPVSQVYGFYIHHYDEIYPKTADKHREFTIINGDVMEKASVIHCIEGEEGDWVIHDYEVRELIPGKMIYKASEPSYVVDKLEEGKVISKCNAYVYVDFIETDKDNSRLSFTIIVQMPNAATKWMGRIIGGKKARLEWESHLREELEGFRNEYIRYEL